jgi:hypothetical protein
LLSQKSGGLILIPSLTFEGHPFIPALHGLGVALAFLLNISKAFKSFGFIVGITPPFFLHLAKTSTP